MENQVKTQSQVAAVVGMAKPSAIQVAKARIRLEQLLSTQTHRVGNRQRSVTGRNYFGKEDLPKYDDEMIVYLCDEVEAHETYMQSNESLRSDLM